MVGADITAPASGPLDSDSSQIAFTPEAIAKMSQEEYAKNRSRLCRERLVATVVRVSSETNP
jgi:hypothetical protein